MHSVTLDSSGSPKKRTFSRGISEDESLRSLIKEVSGEIKPSLVICRLTANKANGVANVRVVLAFRRGLL